MKEQYLKIDLKWSLLAPQLPFVNHQSKLSLIPLNPSPFRLNTITKELVEEKQLGKALQSNLSSWEQKYNTLDKVYKTVREQKDSEIIELKEQIRDLMFYMDTQNKIVNSDMNEELAAGSVIVEQPPPQQTSQTKGRRKKK